MIASDRSQRGKAAWVGLILLPAILLVCGCGKGESASWLKNGLIDPTQVGDFEGQVSSEIRDYVSILEPPSGIEDAEEPSPEDLQPLFVVQPIGPGDMLGISIYELQQSGATTSVQVHVEDSGYATLPVLGRLRMMGFTSRELELELKRILREREILQNADVQVSVLSSQTSQVSLTGQGIVRPGVYALPRPDYRLHELIASAGGISPVIEKIYVFRRVVPPGEFVLPSEESTRDGPPPTRDANELDGMAWRLMMSDTSSARTSSLSDPPEPATQEPEIDELGILEGRATSKPTSRAAVPTPPQAPAAAPTWDPQSGEWVFEGESAPESEPAVVAEPDEFAPGENETATSRAAMHDAVGSGEAASAPVEEQDKATPWDVEGELAPAVRIIEIPRQALMNGDPRYNIVLRPYDIVEIPAGDIGEFYLGGNIARPGAYSLTGRRLTVKQAVISAGGFNPLAWPSRAQLIRQISPNEEQSIQLDLDAIFAMKSPDFYVKPNDIIQVGTTPLSPFLAVLRNAFRFSYGFGFVYDRNFGDQDTATARLQEKSWRAQQRTARGLPP